MDPSDKTLISLSLEGDTHAYGMLVERYQHALYRHCYLLVYDEAEAQDIAQDTFIKAYQKLPTYNADYAFSTWLFTIARNKGLSVLRSPRIKRRLAEYDFDQDASTAQTAEERMQLQEVRQAVSKLPAKYREIVSLHYWDGLPYAEIALVRGTTEGTIKGQMSRAKELLRKELS